MVSKNEKIEIAGRKYKTADLSDKAKTLLEGLAKLGAKSRENANMVEILTKAKKAYMADLKGEMLRAKAGFDFSE